MHVSPLSSFYASTRVPLEFKFSHPGDQKGALFFLGSSGYTKQWANPDSTRRQVRTFASSVNFGRPADVLDRDKQTGVSTKNHPFSFYGVQLMHGRKIVPSAYQFTQTFGTEPELARLGGGINDTMLCWRFEGSNNLQDWYVLDTRYNHLHTQAAIDAVR